MQNSHLGSREGCNAIFVAVCFEEGLVHLSSRRAHWACLETSFVKALDAKDFVGPCLKLIGKEESLQKAAAWKGFENYDIAVFEDVR